MARAVRIPTQPGRAVVRFVGLFILAILLWFVGRWTDAPPAAKGLDAAATEFSAARASATLARLLGPEVPHPVSSAANAAVRDRIRKAFTSLGVANTVYRATGCEGRSRFNFFVCGTVEDIVAEVAPGPGKAIVLLAHYDSVPAGPGAADDQSGVATVLETVRALKARGMHTKHPIVALITDGEEAGLLGADAFLSNKANAARVGMVINVEARGNRGPSLLFQTSPGDGPLIDLYAKNVAHKATSSLFAVIYKLLPNDTDLTVFLDRGLAGYNFAFSGNVAHYHTPLDTRQNLSLDTLQHQGDNMLGVASALMQTDFAALNGGDAIYLTAFGRFVPRLPASFAVPLALAALVLLNFAAFVSRQYAGLRRWLRALAMPPLALMGAAATGWVLHEVSVLVSGQPDPSYAYPTLLRIALALGVAAIALLASRMAGLRLGALAVWFWIAALGLVTALFATGVSPYFLFPALIASIVLVAQALSRQPWESPFGQVAILLAALPMLIVWLSLAGAAESVQGLALHPLFTVPSMFAALPVLPLLATPRVSRPAWLWAGGAVAALSVVVAAIAGFQPAFSSVAPQRLNIVFVDDHVANTGHWTIGTNAPLPEAFRAVMPFSASDKPSGINRFDRSFVASPGPTRFAAPRASVTSTPEGNGRIVRLTLNGSPQAAQLFVIVPNKTGLTKLSFAGRSFTTTSDSPNPAGTVFGCATRDCSGKTLTLRFASRKPVAVELGELRFTLPADGAKLVEVRPRTTVASQTGDGTMIFGRFVLR